MASSGNTWFKKLVTKQKAHARKVRGIKKPFAVDGIKSEDYRTTPPGRAPKTYGSVVRGGN